MSTTVTIGIFLGALVQVIRKVGIKSCVKGLGGLLLAGLVVVVVVSVLSFCIYGWVLLAAAGPVVLFLALIFTVLLVK